MGVDMATTQDFANWVCEKALLPDFLLYVFRSMCGEFRRLMMGSTHNTIYMPDIQAFRFALPLIEEQYSARLRPERSPTTIRQRPAFPAPQLPRRRRPALAWTPSAVENPVSPRAPP